MEAQTQHFSERILDQANKLDVDATQIHTNQSELFEISYDRHQIELVRSTWQESCSATLYRDGRKGSVAFNGFDANKIAEALKEALTSMEACTPDECNGIAESESQSPFKRGDRHFDKDHMMHTLQYYLKESQEEFPQVQSKGSYTFSQNNENFCNSAGTTQQEERHIYTFSSMFFGRGESQSTSFNSAYTTSFNPFDNILNEGLFRKLYHETEESFKAQHLPETFEGDVIITPNCLGQLLSSFTSSLGGYALQSGATPFKDKQGQKITSEKFNILNRPEDSRFTYGGSFDGFGIPAKNYDIVKEGVLENFIIDFFISKKLKRDHTGSLLNLIVPHGQKELAQLIKETDHGIILSRFSGGSPTPNLDFSGVAKNSFYIKDGEIQYPLNETMVAGNFQNLFNQIRDLSKEHYCFGLHDLPYLAASGVTISGVK